MDGIPIRRSKWLVARCLEQGIDRYGTFPVGIFLFLALTKDTGGSRAGYLNILVLGPGLPLSLGMHLSPGFI